MSNIHQITIFSRVCTDEWLTKNIIHSNGLNRFRYAAGVVPSERELELYSEGLSKRVSLIIANKMDVPESEENLKRLVKDVKKRLPIFPMSAQEDPDYEELKEVLRDFLAKNPETPDATQTVLVNPQPIPAAKNHDMVEEIYDEDDLSGNGVEIIYAD